MARIGQGVIRLPLKLRYRVCGETGRPQLSPLTPWHYADSTFKRDTYLLKLVHRLYVERLCELTPRFIAKNASFTKNPPCRKFSPVPTMQLLADLVPVELSTRVAFESPEVTNCGELIAALTIRALWNPPVDSYTPSIML